MTAGTEGSASIDSPPRGNYRYREWSGQDGKYESFNNGIRAKWNSYTTHKALASVSGLIVFQCPGVGTPGFGQPHTLSYEIDSLPPWLACPNTLISEAENINRLSKLLAKVKGHSFNAAVSISQAHEFSSMVVSNLGKLGRSVMALKHGDFATAARQLGASPRPSKLKANDIGGRWLELQYGWLPTLSDTYEAAKAFEAISSGPAKTTFRANESHSTDRVYSSLAFGSDSLLVHGEYGRSYVFEMYEELGFARQLGLLDPLSVVWENIPYSFVVDWFSPIGEYLSVLNQLSSLNGRWLITDYTKWSVAGGGYKINHPYPYCPYHSVQYTGVNSLPSVKYSEFWTNRATDGPHVSFPSVTVLGAVHGRRIANAIALAAGRFLR